MTRLSTLTPWPRGRALAATFGSCLAVTGCSRLTLPTGEELASLDRAYDEPKGRVNSDGMEDVSVSALSRLDSILGLGRLDFVIDSLNDVSEVVQDVTTGGTVRRLRVTALTTVEKICPGEGGEPDKETNGALTYTLRVQENGVLDTVWGEFAACRFPDPGERFPGFTSLPREAGDIVTYDGSMDVYLGGNLQLLELDLQHFLFRLEGSGEVGGTPFDVGLDFRVRQDRKTEVRVPADGGDVVFSFASGTTLVGLQTGEGSYCCDFERRACARSGDDCDEFPAGEPVILW